MASLMELINAKKQQIDASKRPSAKKVPEGRSRLRVLPSWRKDPNDLQFWHDYGQHFIKDATDTTKAVYICTEKTFGRPCEVCQAINSAAKSVNDDHLSEIITGAKASARVLVNALHIDGQNPTTPEVFELPPSLFEQLIGLMDLYIKDGVDILSLDSGFDVSIERTGKGLNTKYTLQAVPKSTAIDVKVMEKVQDLDKYVVQENEQNKFRAISEVRAVAGLLPSPTTPTALPATTAALLDVEEDLTQQIPMGTPVPPIAANVVEAEYVMTPEAVAKASVDTTVAVAKAATTPVPAATSTGDDELDKMLAGLNAV